MFRFFDLFKKDNNDNKIQKSRIKTVNQLIRRILELNDYEAKRRKLFDLLIKYNIKHDEEIFMFLETDDNKYNIIEYLTVKAYDDYFKILIDCLDFYELPIAYKVCEDGNVIEFHPSLSFVLTKVFNRRWINPAVRNEQIDYLINSIKSKGNNCIALLLRCAYLMLRPPHYINADVIDHILEYENEIIVDKQYSYAMYYAAIEYNDIDAVKTIFKLGYDVNATNTTDQRYMSSVLDCAYENNNGHIIKYLESKGAKLAQ